MMQEKWDLSVDVAVIGGGACGLAVAATIASLKPDAEVAILEKDSRIPCNAAIAGGMLQAAGTRFQRAAGITDDTPELMAQDIVQKNHGVCDHEVVLALCQRSAGVIHWMVDEIGVDIEFAPETVWIGHSRPRMHAHPKRSGAPLIQALREWTLARPNVLFADQTPGRSLVIDGDAIVGVVGGPEDQPQRVRAHRTVLAAGGFAASPELMARWVPSMVDAPYVGASTNTGEGILMGIQAGAALDYMSAFQGQGFVTAGFGTRINPGVISAGGLMVNMTGRRFEREDQGYSEWAEVINRQPGAVVMAIWDEVIERPLRITGTMRASDEAGAIVRCATVEELAGRLNLDPRVLSETISEYNAGVRAGRDSLGRRLLKKTVEPPYCAAKLVGALAHTQGGLRIDARGHVLDTSRHPIPNLYAGGGTAASISGDGADGYTSGNGLVTAYVLGRIIGEEVAASLGAVTTRAR